MALDQASQLLQPQHQRPIPPLLPYRRRLCHRPRCTPRLCRRINPLVRQRLRPPSQTPKVRPHRRPCLRRQTPPLLSGLRRVSTPGRTTRPPSRQRPLPPTQSLMQLFPTIMRLQPRQSPRLQLSMQPNFPQRPTALLSPLPGLPVLPYQAQTFSHNIRTTDRPRPIIRQMSR